MITIDKIRVYHAPMATDDIAGNKIYDFKLFCSSFIFCYSF